MDVDDLDLFPNIENPFTIDFFLSELDFYGPVEPIRIGNVELDTFTVDGQLNDYFNKNWYEIHKPIPRLKIYSEKVPQKARTWMSITPLEVQSHYLHIFKAQYEVYTAGLGLGYYALRVAAKPDVDKVIIYETSPEVIEIFQRFSNRPEFGKIEIRQGDFLEALRNEELDQDDQIYNDIYPNFVDPDAIRHLDEFFPEYLGYDFWGSERLYLDAMAHHNLYPSYRPPLLGAFFKLWADTSVKEATGLDSTGNIKPNKFLEEPMLKDMYEPICSKEMCEWTFSIYDRYFS